MIIVLQGTPGSGKTTALGSLQVLGFAEHAVPELVLPGPVAGDDYFWRNDLAKAKQALAVRGTVIVDRDFTSTLAYIIARDGERALSVQRLRERIDKAFMQGELYTPDYFFLFHLASEQSVLRQLPTNANAWREENFVRQVDAILSKVVEEYIPSERMCHIDGNWTREKIIDVIAEVIQRSGREATHSS